MLLDWLHDVTTAVNRGYRMGWDGMDGVSVLNLGYESLKYKYRSGCTL